MSKFPLAPGATIGILGGGQLGRMMALAAARLGLKTVIYAPEQQNPAYDVCSRSVIAPYEDENALKEFARSVDVITYEFENVSAHALEVIEPITPIYPSVKALEVTQDRLHEKDFLTHLGLPVAPYRAVETQDDLEKAVHALGRPAMLKTRRFGYDGKGQVHITKDCDLAEIYQSIAKQNLEGQNLVLEAFIPFEAEVSIVAVCSQGGDVRAYDIGENIHQSQILHQTTVPASVPDDVKQDAFDIAQRFAQNIGYVGVFAIEFFYCSQEGYPRLIVNEIAPRVHNTGHWTLDACVVSQFENHIRAIAGWPLGSTKRHSDAVMTNLIGEACEHWAVLAGQEDIALHLYGKETRPGRKMGHYTKISPNT